VAASAGGRSDKNGRGVDVDRAIADLKHDNADGNADGESTGPGSSSNGSRTGSGASAGSGSTSRSGSKSGSGAGHDDVPDKPTEMPKAGWLEILKRSFKQFKHDDVTDRAAALTYFGVLALFPAVLVMISVLGLLGKSTTQKVLNNLGQVAPGAVKSFLTTVINQVQGKAGTAGLAAIIGIAVALWSASGYVAAFMRASNAIYDVDEGRPIWKTAPVRLLTTLVLVVLLLIALVMVVVTGPIATQVGKAFGIGHAATLAWDIAKWPVLLIKKL